MANLLDMQRLLGGTPNYPYQPPVADVNEETQKFIDQLSDEEKRKPQALLRLLNYLGGLSESAAERTRQEQLRRERSRIPVDQERLLSPFRAQPVNPLQGQDLRIGDFRNTFTTDDLLNPDMVKVPPRQQVLMSESGEKPVTSVVDTDNNQQSNNTDNTQNNVDLNNIKSERNQQLGLMLYALGGALRGDKNFVENTIKIQQMQESKKKDKAQKEAFENFIEKYEGEIDPRITDFAKALGWKKGSELLIGTFDDKRKLTAAEQNLETYNEIAKTGTLEEIKLAQTALLGINQGKSKQQLKNEVTATLLRTPNPITGEPYEAEEIQERLNIFDKFYQNSEPSNATQSIPLQVEGYTILEG